MINYFEKYQQMKGRLEYCTQQKDKLIISKREKESYRDTVLEAQSIVQTTAKSVQSKLKFHLEGIVNQLLESCFPSMYTFQVEFEIKRDRTEATLILYKEGNEVKPKGGIADILSLGLRIAVWNISKTRNTLLLDESLKWLSADLQSVAGELVKGISEKLDLQIIMPSHVEAFIECADKVYKIKNIDGKSTLG